MSPLTVIVVGAGIGGLCLAQGLHAAGVEVEVYERDTAPDSRWQGYRIHIDPAGARSLRACLPDPNWATFLATSGPGGDFGFLTTQLEELVVIEESITYPDRADPAEDHYAVDRATLRWVLLAGLEDRVRFGAEFVRYAPTPDGRVEATFADGRRVVGDVLVGADGASSRLAHQYLPQARRVDAGVGGIAHKLWLTDDVRTWLPPRLGHGMNVVGGSGPVSLFTSVYQPPPGASAALARLAPQARVTDDPYLLCALVAGSTVLPADLVERDSSALADLAADLTAGWHPALRRVLAASDPFARRGQAFRVSVPTPAWTPSPVTVLGDAIHTMPATGGRGGNTALRDARLLADRLVAAARGHRPLLDAVGEYEHLLRAHGDAAVAQALATRDRLTSSGRLPALVGRAWFRLCRTVPPVRRRTFASWSAITRPEPWERVSSTSS